MAKAIELLAPAGTAEIGKAAINCGADAVYIGAPKFGAREAAGNSLSDIAGLCRHAHRYRGRVYVAVNTILTDAELEEARRLIWQLYDAGIDAVIVQDMGLLEIDLPPLPLFASTQTHNAAPEKVAFLEKVGFSRVILARELSLEEIRGIRAQTQVALECFVHGALCVSYSGRCSLSHAIGGRSANRGQCAQPCRRRYCLQDGRGRTLSEPAHFLCLKDLNLSGDLAALLDAGITSFKIEGRLKDAAYVMNIVAWYRKLLDRAFEGRGLCKSSSGTVAPDFAPDPQKTFNRGYTRYNLSGRVENCAAMETPAFRGELLGTVVRTGRDFFELATPALLHNGDGICFFDGQGQLQGTNINIVRDGKIQPAKMMGIKKGVMLYRNLDRDFLQQLDRSAPRRLIDVRLTFAETDDGFTLTACDEDGVTARAELAAEKVPAEKPQQAAATITKQLAKLGDTDFTCQEVALELRQMYFLPVALLNELRRAAVEKLMQAREQTRQRPRGGAIINSEPYPEQQLSFQDNVLNEKAAAFYRRHGVAAIEPAAETGLDLRGRRVMTTKYCLRRELGCCLRDKEGAALPDEAFLFDEQGRRFSLRFDCARCVMELIYTA